MGLETEEILRNERFDERLPWTPSFREYWSKMVVSVPVEYIRLYGRLMQDTMIATVTRQAFEAGWKARERFKPSRRQRRQVPPWGVRQDAEAKAKRTVVKRKPQRAVKARKMRRRKHR